MSATPRVRPTLRLGGKHTLTAHEDTEWARLRKAANRNGRKFSKDDYIELLQTEDMVSLRRNGRVDWHLISRKFPGMPSVTSPTDSDRSSDVSLDGSPSTSAESSPADLPRERLFDLPVIDDIGPLHGLAPTPSFRRKHKLSEQEYKEWSCLRKAAQRNGRKFSKDNYLELLQTEDMDSLRRNDAVDWNLISRKFAGMPSATSSTGSNRSFECSLDSSPSMSAENSPVDLASERCFEFPDENSPPQELTPVSSALRKRLNQLATLTALSDLRSAYPDEDEHRRQKHRRILDRDDAVMPVLMINAPVPPPPRLLQPDGGQVLDASAEEHDYLAQLADAMFPAGLEEEDDDDDDDEPPPLANNAPQPPNFANTGKVPLAMRDSTKVKVHYAGKMNKKCSKCDALFYPGEARPGADGSYAPCCSFGAVSLPTTYDDFPQSVYELLKWEHPLSADFHRHVRNYNSSLSFASINCHLDRRFTGPGGPYCFRIHGNVYTLFNNGTYAEGVPSYAQLYVVDSAQATDYRMQHPANEGISRDLLQALDEELRGVNPHAQSYQMLREVEDAAMRDERLQAEALRDAGMEVEEPELPSFKLLFKLPRDVDRRRYNIPRANEIAAVFRTNADGSIPPAELIVHSGNGRTYRLSTLSSLVAPFHLSSSVSDR